MQINSNVNVKNNPTLTQALQQYMETNNIKKDTDVLESFLTEFSKTLDQPDHTAEVDESPKLNPRPDDDLISDKHLEALNLKKLG